jgi:hypothetical protein
MPGSIRSRRLSAATPLSASQALCVSALCAAALYFVAPACAQVFIVQPEHIEQHYAQFDPTKVQLSAAPLTTVGRERLIRFLQSEQGFAMRPLPIGNLDLRANGPMEPGGEKYIDELHTKGICAKPGDRVVVTDIKVREDSIVLDLNGGPEHKHKYLRHISIGAGSTETPLAQDSGAPPTGSRLTLVFPKHVPDLSGEQVEALLKPMIDFGVKSPGEAYAETLPTFLRKAILEHRVLVGMDHDMVIYAKGQPVKKIREQEEGQPIEIWVYGEAPQPIEFVRFTGNYVVRDEVGKVGQPLQVRTDNEMGDYWGTQPVVAANEHQVQLGDRADADVKEENAPKAPPSLRQPGEKLPTDSEKDRPTIAPTNFPPGMQRPGDPGYSPTVSAQQPGNCPPSSSTTPAQSGTTQQPSSSTSSGCKSGTGSTAPAPAQQPATNAPSTASPPTQQLVAASQ